VVVEDAPGRVRVILYSRDPLTATVPVMDPASVPDLRALPVGLAEDGTLYRLRLLGRHHLIAGASDAGKASVLWSAIRAVAPDVASGRVQLQGIDPKRMELVFTPNMFTRLETTIPGAVALLETNVTAMQERQDRLSGTSRQHLATPADPAVVIVIDELASLTAYCTDRDAKKRIEAALSLLLSQGRAVGYYVIAALQDPRKDVVQFRDLFTARICLRVTEASHVDMVLGDGALERGATAHLIPDTLPGVGYVHIDGAKEEVRVRFTWVTDEHLRDMNTRWPAPPAGQRARVVDLRDHTGRVPDPRNTPAPERTDRREGGELA
jgi:S-DNA-T family DNA segregation ATPase FtsK/SpoIIIE